MNRRLTAALMVAAAGLTFVVTSRPGRDDPDARTAYAEYLVACDARDRTSAVAREAGELGAGRAADDAQRLAASTARAEPLQRGRGGRWKRLGLR